MQLQKCHENELEMKCPFVKKKVTAVTKSKTFLNLDRTSRNHVNRYFYSHILLLYFLMKNVASTLSHFKCVKLVFRIPVH